MIAVPLPPRRKARIEIIPLIDIVFFLLATFVMVSLSMVKNTGLAVKLPSAVSAKALERGSTAILSVSREGEVRWDKKAYGPAELAAALKAAHAADPETRLIIQGDERAEYGRVVAVLDAARQAGLTRVAVQTAKR